AVREARGARRRGRAEAAPCAQVRLPTDPPEPHEEVDAVQEAELLEEVRLAARELLRRWLVGGRRAAERGGDVRAAEPEAVVPMSRGRAVGEARVVKGVEEPVAAPVAREHPARAVPAVRRGRKPDEEEARARIAEARQRPGPVALTRVPARRRRGGGFAMGDEPRAGAT